MTEAGKQRRMEGRLHLVYHSERALIKNRINLLDVQAQEEADLSHTVCPQRRAEATER